MQLTETPEREMSSLQQNSYWAAPTRRTMERLRSQRPFVKKEKEYLPTRQQRTKMSRGRISFAALKLRNTRNVHNAGA